MQKMQKSQNNFEEENKFGGHKQSDFKSYSKATVIKTKDMH